MPTDQVETVRLAIESPEQPVALEFTGSEIHVTEAGEHASGAFVIPGVSPTRLGGDAMTSLHRIRYPYVCGEMANGIATVRMVRAAAESGFLGFFGAAGLAPDAIERALLELNQIRSGAWGSNLIHSPAEPELEEKTADLYISHQVRRISASAFMNLRASVVRCACHGLRELADGGIERAVHIFAKVSRPEVARQFLSPPPENMLNALLEKRQITAREAALARRIPVATHVTVEADSGGHTDNGALSVLVPAVLRLAAEISRERGWREVPLVGAAGGIGTPGAVAAAFAMGASYVMTGSVNQVAVESGQSEPAKRLLAQARAGDVTMAPAGDMFEQGIRVQVLKRGTMFPVRASKLSELYRRYDSLDQLPVETLASLEKDVFRQPIDRVWASTRMYFLSRRPSELTRADRDPKHKMALLFRWYLGQSSRWPLEGDASRQIDYQVWCGPAMGAFNHWVEGTFLEDLSNRTVAEIALNLMHGAASITRAHQLRTFGVSVPVELFHHTPRPLSGTRLHQEAWSA